mmetsp:Transcript_56014/g.142557  ORF Transcript_56014/g.142557 Transcript_56014/m.142557 type:complete len:497 (-) Transcript_56014:214-1704(-)
MSAAAGWSRVVHPEAATTGKHGCRAVYAALGDEDDVDEEDEEREAGDVQDFVGEFPGGIERPLAAGRGMLRVQWKRVVVWSVLVATAATALWLGAARRRGELRPLRSRVGGAGTDGSLQVVLAGQQGRKKDREGKRDRHGAADAVNTDDDDDRGSAGHEHSHGRREPYCGSIERNVEFVGIPELRSVSEVPSAGICCTICQQDPQCRAWTWGPAAASEASPGLAQICRLMSLQPIQGLTRVARSGLVSGQPFRRPSEDSLFCFSLSQPQGYELGLLALQHKLRTGIFACDEFAVYSNKVIEVAPGVNTSIVNSNLKCEKGGEFGTALNTDIFMAVWTKVISDGRYRYNEWTAKVDPDSVFFAERLRIAVHFHAKAAREPRGAYLNNCKFGLHGPLEVFSQLAVLSWAAGSAICVKHFDKLCSGPCLWGEDMFIDQCLQKVLMVKRINDWNLLSEAHCDSKDWEECRNGAISFHPFKSESTYKKCMVNARYGALPDP